MLKQRFGARDFVRPCLLVMFVVLLSFLISFFLSVFLYLFPCRSFCRSVILSFVLSSFMSGGGGEGQQRPCPKHWYLRGCLASLYNILKGSGFQVSLNPKP